VHYPSPLTQTQKVHPIVCIQQETRRSDVTGRVLGDPLRRERLRAEDRRDRRRRLALAAETGERDLLPCARRIWPESLPPASPPEPLSQFPSLKSRLPVLRLDAVRAADEKLLLAQAPAPLALRQADQ
jgi:hypothetical protein